MLASILMYQVKDLKKLNDYFLWDNKEKSETTCLQA